MRLNSWLANVCQQLTRSSIRTLNRRHRGRSLTPAVVELLEQRKLLTGSPVTPSQNWTSITATIPNADAGQIALELPNGQIMVHGTLGGQGGGESANWYLLSPDSTGGYQNGTWTQAASMNVARLYFGSDVLPNGDVFVVGGEYATDGTVIDGIGRFSNSAEIYNPATNVWTLVASSPLPQVGDEPTELLPNGTVLVGDIADNGTEIYNPASNTWSTGGAKIRGDENSDEESWVKLANGEILTYDMYGSVDDGKGEAELYNPSTNTWSDASAGTLPILTSAAQGFELGPAVLLPDGRAFFTGATGLTAFYNPATNLWSQGPNMPSVSIGGTQTQLTTGDASGAVLPNGDVLLSLSPAVASTGTGETFPGPTFLYDFNPTTNIFTDVTPTGNLDSSLSAENSFTTNMLVLPTGQIMVDNFISNPLLYTPSGAPDPSWEPQITSFTNIGNGNFTLTGTQLNGPDEGAAYGDDNQSAEDYPIVQVTDLATGKIYYATTSNWSLVGAVATGSTPETVNVAMPAAIGSDRFSITVIADGISSAVDNVFAPSDIQLSNSTVVEHSAVGTVVGSFSSSETGTGHTFTYSLVSGTGSTDNASFSINANGQLTTNAIFDFNTKSTYSIRVRTTDESNDTFEKVFTITVLPRQPKSLTVDILGDTDQAGHTTLRDAIATADLDDVGDTITFAPNLTGTITLTNGELPITAPMTIVGPGALVLAISANKGSRIFDIDDTNPANPATSQPVTITGLTLTQGTGNGTNSTGAGGAVFNAQTLVLNNVAIIGNTASNGGGVANTGVLTIYDDTFSSNSASANGGGVYNSGTVTATNVTIFGNTANVGGGVSNSGTFTTANVTIAGNSATTSGGGFHNATGTWNTINTIIAANTIPGVGTSTPSDAENIGGTVNAQNTLFGDAATSAGITDGANGNLVGRAISQIFATDSHGNPVLGNNGGSTLTVAMAKGSVANDAGTALATLASPAFSGATTLTVNDATYLGVGDLLKIGSEIFLVTAINSNVVTVLPAQNGTTAASFAQNATVSLAYDETGAFRFSIDLGALLGTENHPPVGSSNLITILENTSYTFKVNDFGFSDPDDTPPDALSAVKITTLPLNETLTDNGIAVTKGQSVSATDIGAGLLVYTPAQYGNGSGYGTFTFQVQDNGGTAGGGVDTDLDPKTMSIDVTRINSAPVGTSGTVTDLENTPYTFKTSDFGFTDPHDNPANILLAVEITTLPTVGTLTDSGVKVTAGQFVSATDVLSQQLVFTPVANQVAAAYTSFTFQVQDDGGTANGGQNTDPNPKTLMINLATVNEPPVGTSATLSGLQNTAYVFKTSDFGFSDHSNNPSTPLSAVKFSLLPNAGSLTDNGTPLIAGQFVSASDISHGKLMFTPNPVLSGGPFFLGKFQVQNSGGTANGGQDLDPNPKILDIQLAKVVLNHAPVGMSGTVTTNANTPYTLRVSDFGFTDPNDTPPNSLLAVKISLLPTLGTITDNGVAVAVNQSVSAADISAGKLIFTPMPGLVGGPYFLCKFQVQDNGGTANGGVDLDPNAKVLDIKIASIVNHAPTGASGTVTTVENTPYTIKTSDFGFSDPNDTPPNTLLAVKFSLLPNAGTITDNGIAITVGQSVSAADIAAGKLVFTPKTNLAGGPYFLCKFQVQDNGGTASGGVDLDPIPKILDISISV